jgi:glycosidase
MQQSAGNSRLILYQLFVRTFANEVQPQIPGANWSVNGSGTLDQISPEMLASIRDLGCNAVWLTGLLRHASRSDNPAYQSPKSHPSLVKGMAGSPYAIEDFFSTDPDLHSRPEEPWLELEECLHRIHAQGMKAFIDFVPNHCARFYRSEFALQAGLRDLGEGDDKSQEFSPNNHFYYLPGQDFTSPKPMPDEAGNNWEEHPVRATGNDCFSASPSENDWYETVKLNYGLDYRNGEKHFHPEPPVWHYMKEVLLFWAEKGFDGFRCDMAEMVPSEFWAWVIPQLRYRFPECIFIAEIYQPHRYAEYLGAGCDFLYDKMGMYDSLRAVLEGHSDCARLTEVWQQQEGIGQRMLRFLENHDEQRIASRFAAGNAFHAIPAFALAAFSSQAALMLYAGQEWGEKAEGSEGFSGDDGRSSIFDYAAVPSLQNWRKEQHQHIPDMSSEEKSLREEYRKILRLAGETKALFTGHFFDLQYVNPKSPAYDARRIYSFLRWEEDLKLLITVNFSGENQQIHLRFPELAFSMMNFPIQGKAALIPWPEEGESNFFEVEKSAMEGIEIQVQPHSYRIFRLALPD